MVVVGDGGDGVGGDDGGDGITLYLSLRGHSFPLCSLALHAVKTGLNWPGKEIVLHFKRSCSS